ncbi:MAG: prepilin-type N-terminal cleavage/methylation domain-containing protein [Candidatus Hydrogenedentes bacterium]|nr:prepilin-type N-terminal cleavage/methylation domain-containing protein [Candidatus Hydrogenedentota bacterium]
MNSVNKRGFTLIELMIACALFVIVTGILVELYFNMDKSTSYLDRKTVAREEARRGIQIISRELRQAAGASISALPGEKLSFRIAVDADGNGLAVDKSAKLELSEEHVIGRDYDDANQDGLGEQQLVLLVGGRARVLANALAANEDLNGNGVLDPGEDGNGNQRLERGIWFETGNKGVVVTLETAKGLKPDLSATARMTALVVPRN